MDQWNILPWDHKVIIWAYNIKLRILHDRWWRIQRRRHLIFGMPEGVIFHLRWKDKLVQWKQCTIPYTLVTPVVSHLLILDFWCFYRLMGRSKSISTPAFPRPVSRGPTFVNNSPVRPAVKKRHSGGEAEDGVPGIRRWWIPCSNAVGYLFWHSEWDSVHS